MAPRSPATNPCRRLGGLAVSCLLALAACTGGASPSTTPTGTTSPTTTPPAAIDYFAPGHAQAFLDESLADSGADQVVVLTIKPSSVYLGVARPTGARIYTTDEEPTEYTGDDLIPIPADTIDVEAVVTRARTTLTSCGTAEPVVVVRARLRGSPTVSYGCSGTARDVRWLDTGKKVSLDVTNAAGIDAALARLSGGWPAAATEISLYRTPDQQRITIEYPAGYAELSSLASEQPSVRLITSTHPLRTPSATPAHVFARGLLTGALIDSCRRDIFGADPKWLLQFNATADGHAVLAWPKPSAKIPQRCRKI